MEGNRAGGLLTAAPQATRVVAFSWMLGLLVAVGIGCGGTSQDSPESVVSPPAETALELLQRSNRAMATAGSFRARTTVEGISLRQEIEVLVEAEVGGDEWTHTRMSIEGPEGATEVEQVLTGQHAYSKISGEGAWSREDLDASAEVSGLGPLGFYNGLFPGGDFPWEEYSVKSAGLRRIYGVKTEHLEVDLDFQEAWAALNPERQQQLRQLLGVDAGPEGRVEQLEYESIDIWIDVSGYVRQLEMAISAGDDTSLEVGMVLTDYGKRIDIEEPEEYVDVS